MFKLFRGFNIEKSYILYLDTVQTIANLKSQEFIWDKDIHRKDGGIIREFNGSIQDFIFYAGSHYLSPTYDLNRRTITILSIDNYTDSHSLFLNNPSYNIRYRTYPQINNNINPFKNKQEY